MAIAKQEVLIIAIIMIIVGSIIWLMPWPVQAEPATSIIGQVVFWIGIALLLLWFILIAIYYAKS
jgi:hypothetical protein